MNAETNILIFNFDLTLTHEHIDQSLEPQQIRPQTLFYDEKIKQYLIDILRIFTNNVYRIYIISRTDKDLIVQYTNNFPIMIKYGSANSNNTNNTNNTNFFDFNQKKI